MKYFNIERVLFVKTYVAETFVVNDLWTEQTEERLHVLGID